MDLAYNYTSMNICSNEQKSFSWFAVIAAVLVPLSLLLNSYILHRWLRSVGNSFAGKTFYCDEIRTSIWILEKDSLKRQNSLVKPFSVPSKSPNMYVRKRPKRFHYIEAKKKILFDYWLEIN